MRFFALCALCAGCDGGSIVTDGRSLDVCVQSLPPACGTAPTCVLDDASFLQGQFPGGREFIVHTDGPATLDIQILLSNEESPGTELLVKVHEANCSDTYVWDSNGRDIFRVADQDGILDIQLKVEKEGDHPVEILSDAYCQYDLIVTLDDASS